MEAEEEGTGGPEIYSDCIPEDSTDDCKSKAGHSKGISQQTRDLGKDMAGIEMRPRCCPNQQRFDVQARSLRVA